MLLREKIALNHYMCNQISKKCEKQRGN